MVMVVIAACSGGSSGGHTQEECDSISEDIRKQATARGISYNGICSRSDPQIQKDFGDACRRLRECEGK